MILVPCKTVKDTNDVHSILIQLTAYSLFDLLKEKVLFDSNLFDNVLGSMCFSTSVGGGVTIMVYLKV